MSHYTAIYDACVLYPAPLRDLLLRLAQTGLFRARWTDEIHDEWMDALVREGRDYQKLLRTRELMDAAVPDCLIREYQGLIDSLDLPDPDDRHVLAAAIKGAANVIVTFNLRDFPERELSKYQIEAQHPDEFVICQIDLHPVRVYSAVKAQRAALRNPAYTVEQFLSSLERQQLPQTVERLREASDLI